MKKAYLLYIAAFFSLGEIAGKNLPFFSKNPIILPAAGFIFLLFLILSLKRERLFFIWLFVLAAILGAMRYEAFNAKAANAISNFIGRQVLLEIEVASDPLEGKSLTAEAKRIILPGGEEEVRGKVLIRRRGNQNTALQYGDMLRAKGKLGAIPRYPLGKSDYRKFLANKRIYAALYLKKGSFEKIGEDRNPPAVFVRFIYRAREKLGEGLRKFFKSPYSGIMEALFLGRRGDLAEALKESLSKTGTFHILAISGLHVGILYFILRLFLKILKVPRAAAVIASVLILASYALLTGARPSILRATVMFSVFSLGDLLGRRTGIYNILGISALLILFFNPNQFFEIGFVLSYGAVLSIVYIAPKIYALSGGSRSGRIFSYLRGAISVSFAAWIGLLGLIAYYFEIIAPVTVIANILIVPLLFAIMGSGILFFITGFLCDKTALIFAGSATFFIFLLVKIVEFLREVPYAYFNVYGWGFSETGTYYIALFSIILITRQKRKEN